MNKIKTWLDSRSIKNLLKKGVGYFNRHAVSIIFIATATGACIYDFVTGDPISKYFLAMMVLFSVRGVIWEEAYWQQAVEMQKQLKTKAKRK